MRTVTAFCVLASLLLVAVVDADKGIATLCWDTSAKVGAGCCSTAPSEFPFSCSYTNGGTTYGLSASVISDPMMASFCPQADAQTLPTMLGVVANQAGAQRRMTGQVCASNVVKVPTGNQIVFSSFFTAVYSDPHSGPVFIPTYMNCSITFVA